MKNNNSKRSRLFSTRVMTRLSLLIALNIILSRFLGMFLPVAGFPSVKVSFSHVPIFVAGMLYGPSAGFACGFVSDYLGSFIDSGGGMAIPGFRVLFALSSGLVGVIPALVFRLDQKMKINYLRLNTMFIILASACLLGVFYAKGELEYVGALSIFLVCTVALLFIHLPKLASRIRGTRGNDELFEKIYFSVSMSRIVTSVFLNTYLLSVLFGKGFMVFLPGRILSNLIMIPLLSIGTAVVLNVLGVEKESEFIA